MNSEQDMDEYLALLQANAPNEDCPVQKTLAILNGKWRLLVIFELGKNDHCRFSDLKKAIPKITNTMLTQTLRDLESFGIVSRVQYNEIPPHVEYALTEKGLKLRPIIYEMAKWGTENL